MVKHKADCKQLQLNNKTVNKRKQITKQQLVK